MKPNTILAIAAIFSFSNFAHTQTNTEKLAQVLNKEKLARDNNQPVERHEVLEQIYAFVTDEIAPADPNTPSISGATSMHLAALYGSSDLILVLYKLDGDLNATTLTLNQTPLHWAALKGHSAAIAELIRLGADLNATDVDGMTPLHWAAMAGRTAAIAELIRLGADPNAISGNGTTALDEAAVLGRVPVMAFLVAYGVDLPAVLNPHVDQTISNLLQSCMLHHNLSHRVRLLLDYAVEINDASVALAILNGQLRHGETALHSAVRLGRNDVLELVLNYLLSTGKLARAINALNAQDTPALSFALSMRNFDAANLLLDAGATTIIGNPSSMTLAHMMRNQAAKQKSLFQKTLLRSITSIFKRLMLFTWDSETQQPHFPLDITNHIAALGLQLEAPVNLGSLT